MKNINIIFELYLTFDKNFTGMKNDLVLVQEQDLVEGIVEFGTEDTELAWNFINVINYLRMLKF